MIPSVLERIPKQAFLAAGGVGLACLAYMAYSSPGYFTNELYFKGLLLLEVMIVAVYFYRRAFLPMVLISFLFSGVNLPVGVGWATVRWPFLWFGALVGAVIVLREHNQRFGLFHAIAAFCAMAALASSVVSATQGIAFLKALSLLALFLYCATGVRVAVIGRENSFFNGLLLGAEILIAGIAAFYVLGIEAMGNPNSLGAVIAVVGGPILLWGALMGDKLNLRRRRWALYGVCLYLVLHSRSRAGMFAVAMTFALATVSLRRYRLLVEGLIVGVIVVSALAVVRPDFFVERASSVANGVLYKNGTQSSGVFASREEPWRAAMERIETHLWFGTGFGTTGAEPNESDLAGTFSTSSGVSAENGCSYLAITSWVGILGSIPFLLLLLALMAFVGRTVAWMIRTGSADHPAVGLAMIVFAGLLHAIFEDWLFAPGNYLCVFFWGMAFVLVDVAPPVRQPLPSPVRVSPGVYQPEYSAVSR